MAVTLTGPFMDTLRGLIKYSLEETNWEYNNLTPEEKKIIKDQTTLDILKEFSVI